MNFCQKIYIFEARNCVIPLHYTPVYTYHIGLIGSDFGMDKYKIGKIPDSIYYIPDFITTEEEEYLLHQVNSAPKSKWTQLSHRRLQNWGGLPHPKGMVAEKMPNWLQVYAEKISKLGMFEDKIPNHVLVNEYLPGQGIMPHEDGPLFYPTVSTISLGSHTLLDFYYHAQNKNESAQSCNYTDKEVCVSCEEETVKSFEDRHFCSILLQPRSLIFVQDDMYKIHLHGIKEVNKDKITDMVANLHMFDNVSLGDLLERSTRVSLTIRYVPKLLKANLLFGKRR